MNPIAAALVTGALVIAGKWVRKQPPTVANGVGIAGVALGLALLEQINAELSRTMGALIVISVAVVHFPTIGKAVFSE